MSGRDRFVFAALFAAVLMFSGTNMVRADTTEPAADEPAHSVPIAGTEVSKITLTQHAASRIDVQTKQLEQEALGRLVAPYASVLYDLNGKAWVFTSPQPLTYVRESVVIDLIRGDDAYLKEGPPAGTQVVTVGVPELYGIELGVNGE